ncbi:hypothetical protein ASE01_16095 [Nocardioides sp. Root190]|nr:hypothetical protein ASE01_16095 [Nocardioides sp. Root190]
MPPAERREQILDTALALTATGGVASVTMEAVAEAAKVTKPVVYGAFPNADAVLAALIDREQDRGLALMLDSLPTDTDTDDPVALARTGVETFFAGVRDSPIRWRLLLTPDNLPEGARLRFSETRDFMIAQFTVLCEWAMDFRRSGPMDPVLLAHLFVGAMEMGARLILDRPEDYTAELMSDFAVEIVRSVLEA